MNTDLVLLIEGCGYLPVRDAGLSASKDGSIWATVKYRDLTANEHYDLTSAMRNGSGSGSGWFYIITPRGHLIPRKVTISDQVWRDPLDGVTFTLWPKERIVR